MTDDSDKVIELVIPALVDKMLKKVDCINDSYWMGEKDADQSANEIIEVVKNYAILSMMIKKAIQKGDKK